MSGGEDGGCSSGRGARLGGSWPAAVALRARQEGQEPHGGHLQLEAVQSSRQDVPGQLATFRPPGRRAC